MTGTQLKLIALLSMTIDHIGLLLLPDVEVLRIIGRLAYPIFAYMIAEGCRYTRNRKKYFSLVAGVGLLCSVAYYMAEGSLYQSILITFACSILMIYAVDYAIKEGQGCSIYERRGPLSGARQCQQSTSGNGSSVYKRTVSFAMVFLLAAFFWWLCHDPLGAGLRIDYGFWGIMTPVLVWLAPTPRGKLLGLALGLWLVAMPMGERQLFSLLAVLLLYFYDGTRGRKTGLFFYWYYPLHLLVLNFFAS